jgi:hypothetical protein
MKRLTYILTSSFLSLTSCVGQPKYFEAKGIIDKTKEFSEKNTWLTASLVALILKGY